MSLPALRKKWISQGRCLRNSRVQLPYWSGGCRIPKQTIEDRSVAYDRPKRTRLMPSAWITSVKRWMWFMWTTGLRRRRLQKLHVPWCRLQVTQSHMQIKSDEMKMKSASQMSRTDVVTTTSWHHACHVSSAHSKMCASKCSCCSQHDHDVSCESDHAQLLTFHEHDIFTKNYFWETTKIKCKSCCHKHVIMLITRACIIMMSCDPENVKNVKKCVKNNSLCYLMTKNEQNVWQKWSSKRDIVVPYFCLWQRVEKSDHFFVQKCQNLCKFNMS